MNHKPVPCAICNRKPEVAKHIVDREWGCTYVWIASCPLCKHNHTNYKSSETSAVESWNCLQEEIGKDYA